MRRDENRLGALIFAKSVLHLQNFVQNNNFSNTVGNFVLIVNRPVLDDHSTLAAQVMETLWRKYRILYAFLILSCSDTEVNR